MNAAYDRVSPVGPSQTNRYVVGRSPSAIAG